MKEKLELRKAIKKRKPNFLRQDAQRVKRLAKKWRQPKGMHSKIRRKFGGKRVQPSPAYSSPKEVRGLHPSGLKEVRVENPKGLEVVNPKTDGVIISSKVGIKKKIAILKEALKLKLTILNEKQPENFIKQVEERLSKKKEELKKKQEKKKKSKEEALKKAEEKSKEKKTENLEEKEKKEKIEQKKILEKKE